MLCFQQNGACCRNLEGWPSSPAPSLKALTRDRLYFPASSLTGIVSTGRLHLNLWVSGSPYSAEWFCCHSLEHGPLLLVFQMSYLPGLSVLWDYFPFSCEILGDFDFIFPSLCQDSSSSLFIKEASQMKPSFFSFMKCLLSLARNPPPCHQRPQSRKNHLLLAVVEPVVHTPQPPLP